MHPNSAIDPEKVKTFWENRGNKLGSVPFESIANLEEKPELLELKTRLEQECIFPLIPKEKQLRLLDLGAGVGQWTLRFAEHFREIVAVEYAESLATIGKTETNRLGYSHIEWVISPAESYHTEQPFDIVFISGLFVYLNDSQASRLLSQLPALVKPNGLVILRDGTSILPHRHQLIDRFSEILQADYSAIYRTRNEYIHTFEERGFSLQTDGQVFPEGSPLNKFQETRLRYYTFSKTQP